MSEELQRGPGGPIDPESEASLRLGDTNLSVVVEAATANPLGTSYVRFVDDDGNEVGYWNSDEWSESEEQAQEVMGAIFGFMFGALDETKRRITPQKSLVRFLRDVEGVLTTFDDEGNQEDQTSQLLLRGTTLEVEDWEAGVGDENAVSLRPAYGNNRLLEVPRDAIEDVYGNLGLDQ